MNKRLIIIITIGVLILAGLGGLLFLAVNKQHQTTSNSGTLQLKKILDERVIAPVASLNGNAIWYFNSQSRLFRVNVDGSGLSEFPLPTLAPITTALWPKTGSDFIAITGFGDQAPKSYYSSAQKIYVNLPKNVQSIDWMPDAMRVLYIWKSSDNVSQQLVLAGPDGTGFTKIADVYWPDLQVKASPDGKTALLYRSSIQGDNNKIYSVDLSNGLVSTVVDTGKNTEAAWLPNGQKFIYAQTQVSGYAKLYIYDLTTKTATDLNLITSLEKITVDSTGQTLYAAELKPDKTGDMFVSIDLNTLKQETYFTPSSNIMATGLLLIGDALYFSNVADSKFYTISK